jgi:hypothetical protein
MEVYKYKYQNEVVTVRGLLDGTRRGMCLCLAKMIIIFHDNLYKCYLPLLTSRFSFYAQVASGCQVYLSTIGIAFVAVLIWH